MHPSRRRNHMDRMSLALTALANRPSGNSHRTLRSSSFTSSSIASMKLRTCRSTSCDASANERMGRVSSVRIEAPTKLTSASFSSVVMMLSGLDLADHTCSPRPTARGGGENALTAGTRRLVDLLIAACLCHRDQDDGEDGTHDETCKAHRPQRLPARLTGYDHARRSEDVKRS